MAGTYDIEQQRIIDRIKCIAFHEGRNIDATFINRQWIADKIPCTTRFVTEWWGKLYDGCFADYSECSRKLKLSNANRNIILSASGKQRKSIYVTEKEIAEKHKEHRVPKTIVNDRHREEIKPLHVIARPLKTETHFLALSQSGFFHRSTKNNFNPGVISYTYMKRFQSLTSFYPL